MARNNTLYVCQSCGAAHPRWSGKCDACGEWNSIVEETTSAIPTGAKSSRRAAGSGARGKLELVALDGESRKLERRVTGIAEFDRVVGGGMVPGSALLVGGDPGIGKSTLLLQVTGALASGAKAIYISGEESIDQVRMRARRLGVAEMPVGLATATDLNEILGALNGPDTPDIVIIDSIQTMYVGALDSAPGTVAQVRACAQELIRAAKHRGFTLVLVGHVTKEGTIAGPRVLEHMVDTVLYFEGERGHQFRILRAVKNRFGPTDEIGVFEMTGGGLAEVSNPSQLFLSDRDEPVSGAAVFAGMEGSRPMLVEIQALVAPSPLGTPRRATVGWDSGRLSMVLAVLEARAGVHLAGNDVYLNVAGGLRITEPAADLAVAAALVSSLTGRPVPAGSAVFGEIGLSGEVRPVAQAEARLKEAGKLGFTRAITPRIRQAGAVARDLQVREIADLGELVLMFEEEEPTARAVLAKGADN
ncbi:MAG: DNA repair protein RadA [Alphaproteobacteria bacterium]|nr:DNA repair protein RadA [Alphaproteobacteria bacterium]MDH5556249.1 DNA repair protein RadA [Alphaproteobacteria bacterium]